MLVRGKREKSLDDSGERFNGRVVNSPAPRRVYERCTGASQADGAILFTGIWLQYPCVKAYLVRRFMTCVFLGDNWPELVTWGSLVSGFRC